MSATTHPVSPEELMAHFDGELPADRLSMLTAHVSDCAECLQHVTEMRNMTSRLAEWQVSPVPPGLESDIAEANRHATRTSAGWSWRVWAVGAASAFAALVLLFGVATPNLLRSKMAANEASAVGSLRTLNTAAADYSSTYGHYPPSLENFGPPLRGRPTETAADLVDPALAGGRKSGYQFNYRRLPGDGRNVRGGYAINADPAAPGSTGARHFSTNQTGVIFAEGEPLDVPSPAKELSQRVPREQESGPVSAEPPPMIARTAELKIVVQKLDQAREEMDRILARHKGYVGQLSLNAEGGSDHTVVASLRVPADQLDACITELKKLGRIALESQSGEEVTQQHVDLVARLKNSRNTEARLDGVLRQRDGKVKDILDVEKESARVRGEIEQMEAERETLEHRVDFATLNLTLAEEFKAQLSSPAPSLGTQWRNSVVTGFRNGFESLFALILFLSEIAPVLLLWLAILFPLGWLVWRRFRAMRAALS